jgi:hypothetical protein
MDCEGSLHSNKFKGGSTYQGGNSTRTQQKGCGKLLKSNIQQS